MRFVVEVMPSTFGMEAGAAKSAFDPDSNTLKVFVDMQRMADRQQLATLVGCEVTSHLRTDWLDDSNIALLRATGNIIPDVVIQDNRIGTQNRTSPHGDAIAKLEREAGITPTEPANDANFAIYKEVCAAGNITMPFWDWLDAGKPTSMPIAAPLQTGPLQSYSVTWRRPTAAYAHDEIEAFSIENAMMQAKTMATSNRSDLFFDVDNDSMDACDWISVEGAGDGKDALFTHTEWELPKPSAGVLMKALHDITAICDKGRYQKELLDINAIIQRALIEAIPGGELNEPHTYDDERG